MHAARDRALQRASLRIGRLAQVRQLITEFIEQAAKAPHGGIVGGAHVSRTASRLHDQVDRTILQMKPPAIGQEPDLRGPRHARGPGADCCKGI
jgi:hypothetical protein